MEEYFGWPPVLKKGICWRVGDGASIRPLRDKWIPNHPSNMVLFPPNEEQWEWRVLDLIDPFLRCWDRDSVLQIFQKEDAEAILRIPLSRRHIPDSVMWPHTKDGIYTVKSGYHVATELLKIEKNWAEGSSRSPSNKVWERIWKLRIHNKIKVFAWRAGLNILPTLDNLCKRKIVADNTCELCKFDRESRIHALWECGVARDVWASSVVRLQKFVGGQQDVIQLFEELLVRLEGEELELFLVQAWFIWNQRNSIIHGEVLQAPNLLNKRAEDFLIEFHQAQVHLGTATIAENENNWQPPPIFKFKLNFDAAVFIDLECSGMGVIIRNEKGEVMGAKSTKGPRVMSLEAEALACRDAIEFAVDIGLFDIVIEGYCVQVINAIKDCKVNLSRLGHVIEDIQVLISGLRWAEVRWVTRSANLVAHSLARYAKNISNDVMWLEDSPPPALESLYHDCLAIME